MSTSTGAGAGAGVLPNVALVNTGPTTAADLPDPEKVQEAESFLQSETQEQAVRDLQQNRTFTVTAALISRLRAQLREQRRADGERRFSDQEVQLAVTRYFNPDSNPMDGLRDPSTGRLNPDLQAALRGEDPASQQQPNGEGQQQQQGLGGDAYRRMVRGQQVPTNQTAVPTPRTPQPPPQQVVATYTPPPPPLPNAPLVRTGQTQPQGADGAPLPDAPVAALDTGVPGEAPVVPTRTGEGHGSPLPETPRRPEGMAGRVTTFLYASNDFGRGTGAPPEAADALHTLGQQAQLLMRGGTPQAPVPVPVRTPNDTFVARTREPSTTKTGERREGGEDRAGGSLDRSLALGMRRQFRDNVC